MLGTLPSDNVLKLVKCIAERDSKSLLDNLNEINQLSVDYFRLIDLILENLQLLAFAKVSEEILDEIDLNKDEALGLMDLLSEDELQLLYQIGLIAKRDMELAPSLSSGFDMALLRMVAFIPNEIQQTKKKVKQLKPDNHKETPSEDLKEEENNKIQEVEKQDILKIEEGGLEQELDISAKQWNQIFDQLTLDPGTKQLASHCYFIKSDETIIYLSMPEEKLNLFSGKHRKELQDALSTFFEVQCNLFLEVGDFSKESPNEIKEEEKRKELKNAQKEIEQDPNVQSLVEAFGAKVIESSIEPRSEK